MILFPIRSLGEARSKIFGLTLFMFLNIIILTVPDTPLNDADHAGSFFNQKREYVIYEGY